MRKIECIEMEEFSAINEQILSHAVFAHKNDTRKLERTKKTIAYICIKANEVDMALQQHNAEEIVKKYVNKNELNISEFYIDIVPNRNNLKNRASLKKVLKLVKKKEIGQILIPDINHISRNLTAIRYVIDQFIANDVKVVCCLSNLILG